MTIIVPIILTSKNKAGVIASLELLREIVEILDFDILSILACDTSFIPNLVMTLSGELLENQALVNTLAIM